MDYVADSGVLLVGTNSHTILPEPIADLMRFENNPRRIRGDMEDMSGFSGYDYGEEEAKDGFSNDGDDYVLQGDTLDEKLAKIMAAEHAILAQDRTGDQGEEADQ